MESPNKKSFFRIMIEEKNLQDEIIMIEHKEKLHIMEMAVLLTHIEKAPMREQTIISNTFRKIDFFNGNLMEYLNFLALTYIQTNH